MLQNDETSGSLSKEIAKLNELVAWFEGDDFELEQAMDKFQEAKELADSIKARLDVLKNKVTILKKDFSQE